jgi:hypothetical protein
VILTTKSRVIFIRDFERICRDEISLALAGQVLRLLPGDKCYYLAFEHGRVCVATVRVFSTHSTLLTRHLSHSKLLIPSFSFLPSSLQLHGLYIVDVDRSPSIDSAKVVLMRPYVGHTPGPYQPITCMQLTDRRIYFTWEDARRRDDVPLYTERENALGPLLSETISMDEPSHETWPWLQLGGCFASDVVIARVFPSQK